MSNNNTKKDDSIVVAQAAPANPLDSLPPAMRQQMEQLRKQLGQQNQGTPPKTPSTQPPVSPKPETIDGTLSDELHLKLFASPLAKRLLDTFNGVPPFPPLPPETRNNIINNSRANFLKNFADAGLAFDDRAREKAEKMAGVVAASNPDTPIGQFAIMLQMGTRPSQLAALKKEVVSFTATNQEAIITATDDPRTNASRSGYNSLSAEDKAVVDWRVAAAFVQLHMPSPGPFNSDKSVSNWKSINGVGNKSDDEVLRKPQLRLVEALEKKAYGSIADGSLSESLETMSARVVMIKLTEKNLKENLAAIIAGTPSNSVVAGFKQWRDFQRERFSEPKALAETKALFASLKAEEEALINPTTKKKYTVSELEQSKDPKLLDILFMRTVYPPNMNAAFANGDTSAYNAMTRVGGINLADNVSPKAHPLAKTYHAFINLNRDCDHLTNPIGVSLSIDHLPSALCPNTPASTIPPAGQKR